MNKPVKTHTFNGRKYLITLAQLDGICDTYSKEREIIILTDLNTRKGLETAIHEGLHASCWPAGEDAVLVTAKDIASFLWRIYDMEVKEGIKKEKK